MSHATKYPRVVGYTLVEQIGGGGFSRVYRATNFETASVAAVKVVLLHAKTTDQERQTLEREMRIHQALKHVNVIEFMDAVVVENKGQKSVYTPGVYMLLEMAGAGDLFDKIAPDVGIDSDMAHFYFTQLCQGVQYIHTQGVVHRDLKPENILLDSSGTLKLSDFGLASVYMLKETGKTRMLSDVCGSLPYVAPELSNMKPYKGPPVDVWGLGVILFTLLVGNTPWDEPTLKSPEYREYVSGNILHYEPWNRIPGSELSLVMGMLTVDPNKRIKLDEVFGHPWMNRSSQIGTRGLAQLAEQLTQNLRATGDLDIAHPREAANAEGDIAMATVNATQFTQSLLLFSQTQAGSRHTPQLTRFYASLPPSKLLAPLQSALATHAVQYKLAPFDTEEQAVRGLDSTRLQIAAYDSRKELLKGFVEIEPAPKIGEDVSLCVFKKDQGNPLSWRKLWKLVAMDSEIAPHVLRKRGSEAKSL